MACKKKKKRQQKGIYPGPWGASVWFLVFMLTLCFIIKSNGTQGLCI